MKLRLPPVRNVSLLVLAVTAACSSTPSSSDRSVDDRLGDARHPELDEALSQAKLMATPGAIAASDLIPVVVLTSPNAQCDLLGEGDRVVTRLLADDDGFIRLYGAPTQDGAPGPALECDPDPEDSPLLGHFRVQVPGHPARDAIVNAPPGATVAALHRPHTVRPALTGDPLAPSQEELHTRGYPSRPEPLASGAYSRWLHAVSKPAEFVKPKTMDRPGVFNNLKINRSQSARWSGWASINPVSPLQTAVGTFVVPSVTIQPTIGYFATGSFWLGVDGDSCGKGDVIQDGVQFSQVYAFSYFAIYQMWVEYFPYAQQNINMAASPGDAIFSETGYSGSNGGHGWYLIENDRTNQITSTSVGQPPGATFSGCSSDYIVEAQPNTPLADYGHATLYDEFGISQSGNLIAPYCSGDLLTCGTVDDIWLENSQGGVLSAPGQSAYGSHLDFYWFAGY